MNASAQIAARTSFVFRSAAHLLRIEPQRAATIAELLDGLRTCSDASIFEHTFQTLREHHFITRGFSNDFAHWVLAACNEATLAEQLTAVDVREFTDIAELRKRLVDILEEYVFRRPDAAQRPGFEPFYFCASELFVVPTPYQARNLAEFADCLRQVSVHSIHYHFVDARLRLKLDSNNFSVWLEEALGLHDAAQAIKRIDIYTLTLEGVRQRILQVVQKAMDSSRSEA
ncbi:MAG TPA: DUF5752 family protein [Terriglobales bacterium]|nr:DUF5752 family protein [Terriglobales bacterium]